MAKPASRLPPSKARRLQAAAAQAALEAAEQAAVAAQAAAAEKAAEQAEKAAEKTEKSVKTTLDDAKKLLDGSALTNRNLLIAYYLLLVTGLMLCLGVSDEQLLLNKAPVPLPFLNLTLPIWAFASVVPLLLLVVHFDLLHNLNEHSHKLQAWLHAWDDAQRPPAQGGAGLQAGAGALSDQLFPFVYDFAWLHGCGRGQVNINSKLLPGLSWALYCWAPFTVLIVFLIRFADLQDYWFTGWHVVLILLDAGWLYWYWPRFPKEPPAIRWLPLWLRKRLKLPTLLMPVSILAGCWTIWLFGEIQWVLDFDGSPERVKQVIEWEWRLDAALVPRITVPGFEVQLPPNHFAMSKLLKPGKTEAELWPETNLSINLIKRRLGFADLQGAVLPRANLRGAKLGYTRLTGAMLLGAKFELAQLRGADLTSAQLQGASLAFSDLQGANLPSAQLQGASLAFSLLQGTTLAAAQLQGADLYETQLQGADLFQTQLQGANLNKTQLQGADLREATMLGTIIDRTALLGAVLPENAQLIATSGTPTWGKPNSPLHEGQWSKARIANTFMQRHLPEAAQRINTAKPQTLPIQDPQQFAQAWLNTVCLQAEVAKAMLNRPLPAEINDTALRDWIKPHVACQPYQTLAENAIVIRARGENRKIRINKISNRYPPSSNNLANQRPGHHLSITPVGLKMFCRRKIISTGITGANQTTGSAALFTVPKINPRNQVQGIVKIIFNLTKSATFTCQKTAQHSIHAPVSE
jgi:uncharacterized protein YjbI with pentapeptide repeats